MATWSWRSAGKPSWSSSAKSRSVWLSWSAPSKRGKSGSARSRSAKDSWSWRSSWRSSGNWSGRERRKGGKKSRGERWAEELPASGVAFRHTVLFLVSCSASRVVQWSLFQNIHGPLSTCSPPSPFPVPGNCYLHTVFIYLSVEVVNLVLDLDRGIGSFSVLLV